MTREEFLARSYASQSRERYEKLGLVVVECACKDPACLGYQWFQKQLSTCHAHELAVVLCL